MFICLNTAMVVAIIVLPGCKRHQLSTWFNRGQAAAVAGPAATDIEFPDVKQVHADPGGEPLTIKDDGPREYWDLSLQEAVQITLQQSKVLRDLGGSVLQSPDNKQSVYSPAVTETDPRFGVEAALSAFDAAFSTSAFFEKNDRQINNSSFPPNNGGVGKANPFLKQDLIAASTDITKKSATGTEYTVRHTVDYDYNNSPLNLQTQGEFGAWDVGLEGEVRHPLLRGGGVEYNRVVGPNGSEGAFNGVLIARINSDISLADFEIGVRNLISDVENAYWELYFAYRDLDAKIAARARALETWRRIHALYALGRQGGEAAKEAQAREQYFRLDEDVQNALTGKVIEKSTSNTFRGLGGVHANERRLRLIMGVQTNDGRLIRPSQEPVTAKVSFNWTEAVTSAMIDRSELRRQQWRIKRRELELNASKQFLLPQLDAVGRYRWRGYGRNLLNANGDKPIRDNAYEGLLNGGFQEWQLGFELSYPVGFRQAHSQIRNAQLNLAREVAVLETQELEIVHDLAGAFGEIERAYTVAQTNYNRRLASKQQLAALEAAYDTADENQKARLLDLLLDAQRRLADAESRFYRSLAEYTVAIKQVHFHQGSLLTYNGVQLSEGRWNNKAYTDAGERERRRHAHWNLTNYVVQRPITVSRGAKGNRGSVLTATLPGQPTGGDEVLTTAAGTSGVQDATADKPETGGLPHSVTTPDTAEQATGPQSNGPPAAAATPASDTEKFLAPVVERDTHSPPGGAFKATGTLPAVRAARHKPLPEASPGNAKTQIPATSSARTGTESAPAKNGEATPGTALPPRIAPVRKHLPPVIDRGTLTSPSDLSPTAQQRRLPGVVKPPLPPEAKPDATARTATLPARQQTAVRQSGAPRNTAPAASPGLTPAVPPQQSDFKPVMSKSPAKRLAPVIDRRAAATQAPAVAASRIDIKPPAVNADTRNFAPAEPGARKLAPLVDRTTGGVTATGASRMPLVAPPAPSLQPAR